MSAHTVGLTEEQAELVEWCRDWGKYPVNGLLLIIDDLCRRLADQPEGVVVLDGKRDAELRRVVADHLALVLAEHYPGVSHVDNVHHFDKLLRDGLHVAHARLVPLPDDRGSGEEGV